MSKINKNSNKFIIYWADEGGISDLHNSLESARKEAEEALLDSDGDLTTDDVTIYEICASYSPKNRSIELVKDHKITE
jgi:uncharacterized protein YihD (DUF1040 family)